MIHSNMAHAWFRQLRNAWNACQADMAQQKNKAGMVCEIWLETSPYKDQPKQMTKYKVHVPKRQTEANRGLPQLRGWQSNTENGAGRPIRFHHGDPSDPVMRHLAHWLLLDRSCIDRALI